MANVRIDEKGLGGSVDVARLSQSVRSEAFARVKGRPRRGLYGWRLGGRRTRPTLAVTAASVRRGPAYSSDPGNGVGDKADVGLVTRTDSPLSPPAVSRAAEGMN